MRCPVLDVRPRGAAVRSSMVPNAFLRSVLAAEIGFVLYFSVIADAQPPAGQTGRPAPAGGVQGRLTWFDRQGKVVGTIGELGSFRTFTVSPDGKRVAVERNDLATQNRDIWLIDAAG